MNNRFYEYYIDEVPLSFLIDDWANMKYPLTFDWVGLLGAFGKRCDIITTKQLILEEITDDDLRKLYSSSIDDDELSYILEEERKEIENKFTMLYGCSQCGDPGCGGIRTLIERDGGFFTWTFASKDSELQFKFDDNAYIEVFENYREQLGYIYK